MLYHYWRKFTTFLDHVYANHGHAVATSMAFLVLLVYIKFFVDRCSTFYSSVEHADNNSYTDPLNEGQAAASENENEIWMKMRMYVIHQYILVTMSVHNLNIHVRVTSALSPTRGESLLSIIL